jgi:hypothetical protein
MAKSTYEANLYLNGRFRDGGAIPALGTVYLAMARADLTAANVTANELAIGTGGYARLAIPTTNADWTTMVSSGGRQMISNVNTLTGATATADWNGGAAIGFWGLYDASTGGNLIRFGAFGTPKTILSADTLVVAPGSLEIFEG